MIARDFRPGAPIRNFVKDLNTVLDTAGELNVKLPIVAAVRDVFQELYDKGLTRHDHSAFILNLEDMNAPVRLGTGPDIPPE
jgi:2-hydroxy-3-oxopropionate reductase